MINIHNTDHTALVDTLATELGPKRLLPITMGIPENLIVDRVPSKTQLFGQGLSQQGKTRQQKYRFGPGEEQLYHADYQKSYFGLTYKKGGWECLRHLEIMANGCVPFVPDIADCPNQTMAAYPKKLFYEIVTAYPQFQFDGHAINVNDQLHKKNFDLNLYQSFAEASLDYVRNHLTTTKVANRLLNDLGYDNSQLNTKPPTILFISRSKKVDYVRDLLLHGLRKLLGPNIIDVRRSHFLYKSYQRDQDENLYGYGFSYACQISDESEKYINRTNIKKRLANGEFDLVIYGAILHGLPGFNLVKRYMPREKIILLDGGDSHQLPLTPENPQRKIDVGNPLSKHPQDWPGYFQKTNPQPLTQGLLVKREINTDTIHQFQKLLNP